MSTDMELFEEQLENAVRFHGHLCGGQVLGVRMAMAGLRELNIQDPKGRERKDFIAFVETDRCAADAILAVTGLTPGKRSVKILDLGKMAATFVHLRTGKAVRVNAREDSREKATALAKEQGPSQAGKDAYLDALISLAEEDLIDIQEVVVDLDPCDLPGPPTNVAICEICGETVLDKREVLIDGKVCCKPCATGVRYYRPLATAEA